MRYIPNYKLKNEVLRLSKESKMLISVTDQPNKYIEVEVDTKDLNNRHFKILLDKKRF